MTSEWTAPEIRAPPVGKGGSTQSADSSPLEPTRAHSTFPVIMHQLLLHFRSKMEVMCFSVGAAEDRAPPHTRLHFRALPPTQRQRHLLSTPSFPPYRRFKHGDLNYGDFSVLMMALMIMAVGPAPAKRETRLWGLRAARGVCRARRPELLGRPETLR